MQSFSTEHSSIETSQGFIHVVSVVSDPNYSTPDEQTWPVSEPTQFHSQFIDCMELYADANTVAKYFDAHHDWFQRCAHPMKVESIGRNAYALVIGQFGSFGYEIEPKIGLDLLPQEEGIYRIETVPVPNYETAGYDVDFRAAMELVEMSPDQQIHQELLRSSTIDRITRVQWQLDLAVSIQFPRFIQALPNSLIQSTGDRLLRQIVRQVSNRLTRKVQEDFCKTHGILLPKRSRKWFFQRSESDGDSRWDSESEPQDD